MMKFKIGILGLILLILLTGCVRFGLGQGAGTGSAVSQIVNDRFEIDGFKAEANKIQSGYIEVQIRLALARNSGKINDEDWNKLVAIDRKIVGGNNTFNRAIRLWEYTGQRPTDLYKTLLELWDLVDDVKQLYSELKSAGRVN